MRVGASTTLGEGPEVEGDLGQRDFCGRKFLQRREFGGPFICWAIFFAFATNVREFVWLVMVALGPSLQVKHACNIWPGTV